MLLDNTPFFLIMLVLYSVFERLPSFCALLSLSHLKLPTVSMRIEESIFLQTSYLNECAIFFSPLAIVAFLAPHCPLASQRRDRLLLAALLLHLNDVTGTKLLS